MNICIYTVHLFLYECITCKVILAFPITVHFIFLMLPQIHKNTKLHPLKKLFLVDILSLLLVKTKDFNQHHIWCFPLPCTGEKSPWTPHTSPAMISCDVLTCSIHGINRHIWSCALWSTCISSQTWLVQWLIQIVLQLEVICQFSRHYKPCQCQIFMENTCVYTNFW